MNKLFDLARENNIELEITEKEIVTNLENITKKVKN